MRATVVCLLFCLNVLLIEGLKSESHNRLRHLRSVGFEHVGTATIAQINLDSGELFNVDHDKIRARRSTDEHTDLHLSVKLDSGEDDFHIKLRHTRSVLDPNAKLVVSNDGKEKHLHKRDINCILTNQPGENLAVVSFCRSTRGIFHHNGFEYAIEPLEYLKKHVNKRSVNRVHVVKRKEADSSTYLYDDIDIESHIRDKRATTIVERPDNFEVETALICDADMVNYLKGHGITEHDDWLEYMLIKWTGVQAIWHDKAHIGYDVKISLKRIDFWETDPEWYSSSVQVGATTRQVCDHIDAEDWPYDHVALQLGRPDGSPLGLSWVGGICNRLRCSGIRKRDLYAIKGPAHEIGHNLGLKHNDASAGYCGDGDGGIMGGSFGVGLSSCNKARLTQYITQSPKYDCLFEVNVEEEDYDLDTAYPGQTQLPDELCAIKYGSDDYVYQPITNPCSKFHCINMGNSYLRGYVQKSSPPPRGLSCGDRMMCIHKDCYPWAESGRDVTELEANEVPGGWSDWGEWSTCSRQCGTGVKVSRRVCNNPIPINSPVCEGENYKVTLCHNDEPCVGDSEILTEQQTHRATEVCMSKIAGDFISSDDYSGKGSWSSSRAQPGSDGRCLVRCQKKEGGYNTNAKSQGLMPDGTVCDDIGEHDNSFRCFEGKCLEFGCDGELMSNGGKLNDQCSVCGGNGDTCEVNQGAFTEPGTKGDRLTVVSIPGLARRVSVKYENFDDQKQTFIELWSKDDVVVISHKLLSDGDLTDKPVFFANAFWYFKYNIGLWTDDTISEPVVAKIHINRDNPNKQINYKYIVPADLNSCEGECNNGGEWLDCGCKCQPGFYGPTCTSTCSTVCRNDEKVDESTCKCNCGLRTYGERCECKHPYKGPLCSICKIMNCENCGVFDEATCRCTCPEGYGGLTCSESCENLAIDCDTRQCDGSPKMENECMAKCNFCTPNANAPLPSC